jgi:hypothetical protein
MVTPVSNDTCKPRRSELLWVQQDSTAYLSAQSGPRTRRLINSHVQRFSKNSQRLNKALDFQANIATFQHWRLGTSTESLSRSESSRSSSSDERSIYPAQEDSQTQFNQRPPHSLNSSSLIRRSIQLPRSVGFTGEAIDPFNATTAKLDPLVLQLLHYYIHVLVPSKWHVDSQSNQKLARIEAASKGVIKGCLADELHMYSLLASMASRMQNLEHWSTAPPTDLYIHKALVALRRYIDAKPSRIETQVFYDMFFLCTAEAYRYNLAASMTHLRAIAQLVEVAGGLNQLEYHMLLETLVQGDIMLAVEQLSTPVFPLTWDPGSFPHARWETVKTITPLRNLGQAVLEDATLPPTLRTIIHDVIQCVQVAHYVWTHPQSPKSDIEWIFLRYLAMSRGSSHGLRESLAGYACGMRLNCGTSFAAISFSNPRSLRASPFWRASSLIMDYPLPSSQNRFLCASIDTPRGYPDFVDVFDTSPVPCSGIGVGTPRNSTAP